MRLDNERLQGIVWKRRREAGEVIRTTRIIRRRAQGEPAPASGASKEVAPQVERPRGEAPVEVPASGGVPQETAPIVVDLAGEPSEEAPTVASANGDAPQEAVPIMVDLAREPSDEAPADGPVDEEMSAGAVPAWRGEGGLAAQAEETGERALIVFSPTGVRTEGVVPTHPEPVGDDERGTAAEEPTIGAERSAAPPAEEEGEAEPTGEGEESPDPTTPASQTTTRCTVEKIGTGPSGVPRPAPRFSMMEDALQAEQLLERLRLPVFL